AFVPGSGKEIARGGRYDAIGRVFGRSRPATGFSSDLKTLIRIAQPVEQGEVLTAIFAPWSDDARLQQEVARLRADGRRVICALPGQHGEAKEMGCDQRLVLKADQWQLISV
ncbi:MAG: ATP phosphoribosyltransferase regulatory subunit, partial [Candidatus Thiodiazotropha sp. (ex Lucinoma borealis)]|nr:ATP phosphoribosyltransferase regulatory subunit [Candidatus Thiodiazotropha sp. (ex Lucinoma borealis)]